MGFPGSFTSKESTCSSGDPGLISGSGRSPGEGIGYPLQYSWDSLVAQMIKNLPAMWETQVRSLGWEDPVEEGMATHSSILARRISWTEKPGGHRIAKQSDMSYRPNNNSHISLRRKDRGRQRERKKRETEKDRKKKREREKERKKERR